MNIKSENPAGAGGASDAIGSTWNAADYIKAPANHQALRWLIHRYGGAENSRRNRR